MEGDQELKAKKSRVPVILLMVLLLAGIAGGVWWWRVLNTTVSTENAKVVGNLVDVSFRVSGRIDAINVKEGDIIEKDTVLARLEDSAYKLALQQAQGGVDQALAKKAQFPYDIQSLQTGIQRSQAGVTAAQARTENARIALEDAKRSLDKNEVLYKQGAISEEVFLASRSKYLSAQKVLEMEQAGVQQAQSSQLDSQQKLQASQDAGAMLLEAQLNSAKANLDTARLNYENTVVKSPMKASVLKISAQIGENISPGQPVILLSDLSDLWINANIEEKKISRIHPGQKAEVRIDAYPGRVFAAKVCSVGDAVQSTFSLMPTENAAGNFTKVSQRIPVKIRLNKTDVTLKPGMSAVVKIKTTD